MEYATDLQEIHYYNIISFVRCVGMSVPELKN
jgi:hypothetical protein